MAKRRTKEEAAEEVKRLLENQRISLKGRTVLAGFSGGADSCLLLLILKELEETLGFSLRAVHVHHGIRGEEADGDALWCERFCKERGIPFVLRSVDIPALKTKEKGSLEELARRERYRIFREERKKSGEGYIACAHHRKDQAETVLLNLFRGSGLHGLTGMRVLEGEVLRPLLTLSKEEICGILVEEGIAWREDSTNGDNAYTRNRIRNGILPLADLCNERSTEHIAEAAETLREIEDFLSGVTEEAFASCVAVTRAGCEISLFPYRKLNGLIRREVLLLSLERSGCGRRDIGKDHLLAMDAALLSEEKKGISLPSNRMLLKQRGANRALLYEKREAHETFSVPLPEETVLYGGFEIDFGAWNVKVRLGNAERQKREKIPENLYTKRLDYDKISNRLVLRNRQKGDYLRLNAKKADGSPCLIPKTVTRYFSDEKIPLPLRETWPLLADGEEIVVVAGKRLNDAYRITEKTVRILEVTVEPDNDGEF